MSIGNIISLLGGLGMFLFGMHYMGEGLELAAGPRMKDLLERLTSNRVMGFLLGAIVTVVIQSSSATTVMVMGFINAGIMSLGQATGVIFGANIGTTITSVLIALDVSGIAPVCICLGAVLILYARKKQHRYVGQVILGFGLLFEGLHLMSSSMSSLRNFPPFLDFISNARNPLLGFLVGAVLCAVIQSSSAAVGVLQALAMQGMMPLHFAAYLICGINVGSSTPALLSALKAKSNAKRAAMIYLIFNVVGTIIFMPLVMITPLVSILESFVADGAFQIASFHILFKVVTGIVLLPMVNWVVKWTYRIIPKHAHESEFRLVYIDPDFAGSPAVAALQVQKEIQRMSELVSVNLEEAVNGLMRGDTAGNEKIADREQVVDYLTSQIADFISKINTNEFPEQVSNSFSVAFHVINDMEQIGDHAVKISEQCERCAEQNTSYSSHALAELADIWRMDRKLLLAVMAAYEKGGMTVDEWRNIKRLEYTINRLVAAAQSNHVQRMQADKCTFERGLTFVESLNSLLRIVNHSVNIAEVVASREVQLMTDKKEFA